MKFLKIIIIVFFVAISINAQSQFTVKTEYSYLKQINLQKNKVLIKDNIDNAEIVVNNIIASIDTPNAFDKLFLTELVTSYTLIRDFKSAFYYSLYQRCLLPNESLSLYQENSFRELAYAVNLNDSLATFNWESSSIEKTPKNINDRIELLLKLTTNLHIDKLESKIYKLGLALRNRNVSPSVRYQHWEYLTIINLKEKHKAKILSNELNSFEPIYKQIEGKYQYKIYRKSIRHYIRNRSFRNTAKLIVEFEAEDISPFKHVGIGFLELKMRVIRMFY